MYDVTVRCNRGEFRLLPTKARRDRLAFFLARAKARHTGIQVAAVCQMTNHIHLLVKDTASQLSGFMRDFLGHFAKSINRLDKLRGTLFERRFTAIPIVDQAAAVRRIAYAVTNPVDAGLVKSHAEWTGLCAWFGNFKPEVLTYFHAGKYRRAKKDAERRAKKNAEQTATFVDEKDFEDIATLELDPFEELDEATVKAAIDERQAELQKEHDRVMGIDRVLAQSPFDRPRMPKRAAMPICLATCRQAKKAFLKDWFAFLEAFRAASEAFRAGDLGVEFPDYTFRPVTSTA